MKWLEALINQNFTPFSFQQHWMKASANRIRASARGRFSTLDETFFPLPTPVGTERLLHPWDFAPDKLLRCLEGK